MKISESCPECPAESVCSVGVERNGERCIDFHNALESKLQSTASNNKQNKSLKIGDFEISQSSISADKVWIKHASGEGSEFNKTHFGKVIEKYYTENF